MGSACCHAPLTDNALTNWFLATWKASKACCTCFSEPPNSATFVSCAVVVGILLQHWMVCSCVLVVSKHENECVHRACYFLTFSTQTICCDISRKLCLNSTIICFLTYLADIDATYVYTFSTEVQEAFPRKHHATVGIPPVIFGQRELHRSLEQGLQNKALISLLMSLI